MKTKLTLLIISQDLSKSFDCSEYFRFFLTRDLDFPNQYLSSKDENTTLKEIFEKYINIPYEWMNFELCDFRKSSINECEVLYSCKIKDILNPEKNGRFVSLNENIFIDEFYGRTISRKFTTF